MLDKNKTMLRQEYYGNSDKNEMQRADFRELLDNLDKKYDLAQLWGSMTQEMKKEFTSEVLHVNKKEVLGKIWGKLSIEMKLEISEYTLKPVLPSLPRIKGLRK